MIRTLNANGYINSAWVKEPADKIKNLLEKIRSVPAPHPRLIAILLVGHTASGKSTLQKKISEWEPDTFCIGSDQFKRTNVEQYTEECVKKYQKEQAVFLEKSGKSFAELSPQEQIDYHAVEKPHKNQYQCDKLSELLPQNTQLQWILNTRGNKKAVISTFLKHANDQNRIILIVHLNTPIEEMLKRIAHRAATSQDTKKGKTLTPDDLLHHADNLNKRQPELQQLVYQQQAHQYILLNHNPSYFEFIIRQLLTIKYILASLMASSRLSA